MGVIRRILFAEDDPRHAAATKALLESAGWTVEWANDGKKAWTLYERHRPDMLLVDLEMPKKDGLSLIRQLRERDKRTPVVLYSGKAGDEELRTAFEWEANDVVRKGVSPTELLSRLENQYRRVCQCPEKPHVYRLGAEAEFNSASGRLKVEGKERQLPWREAALLRLLCESANEAVKDEVLLEQLWAKEGKGNVGQLRKCVTALKKSMGEESPWTIAREADGYALRKDVSYPAHALSQE